MDDDRLVRQATRTARRVMLSVLAATGLLVAALGAERVHFLLRDRDAELRVNAATSVAGRMMLEDEVLTSAANLAAATGEQRWITRYDQHVSKIDSAIALALTLATDDAGRRYQRNVKLANDSLVALEAQAFALIRRERLDSAQALLGGPAYASQKRVLAAGQREFLDELQADLADSARQMQMNSWALVATLVLLSGLGFIALWQKLNLDLNQSEVAFRSTQAEVTQMALHDTLTGLPNRRFLNEHLDRAIALHSRSGATFATVVIDLDGFKPINDRFGHSAGDLVLATISERLSAQVRKDEIVSRLGGDEFVVMLNRAGEDDGLLRAANRLLNVISEPIELTDGTPVRVGASVGIALFPDDALEAEELVRQADVAMYRAKEGGRGSVRFFKQAMDTEVTERALLEMDMRVSIATSEIVPFFQPLIDLQSRRIAGFEALARWNHPVHGMLPPARFIQIAEDTRQIGALTLSVLRLALAEAATWSEDLMLAVNIAPQMLEDDTLVERIVRMMEEVAFAPSRLEVEITESAFIRDMAGASRLIHEFKSHGVSVALDDFGTGYSSLSHLSELPFDKIKIDRSFVQTMRERPQSATIVNAIIGLGRSMHLRTTAEGIEYSADEEMLRELGCVSGQGFLYSKPVPAGEVAGFIAGFATQTLLPT